MTNAEARCNKSLRPRKPEGSLGRTAQDVHLDSHTAPELWFAVKKYPTALYGCSVNIQEVCFLWMWASQVSPATLVCSFLKSSLPFTNEDQEKSWLMTNAESRHKTAVWTARVFQILKHSFFKLIFKLKLPWVYFSVPCLSNRAYEASLFGVLFNHSDVKLSTF